MREDIMIKNGKKTYAIMIVGAVALVFLIAAMPMISMVLDEPTYNTSEIGPNQQAMSPYKTYTDPMGSGDAGWYPKLVIGPDGYGYAVWASINVTMYTNNSHVYTFWNASRTYLNNRVSINIRKTTATMYNSGAITTWNSTTKTLPGIYQRAFCSFLDAAFDNSGHLIVFFSNNTIINGTSASLNTFSALLWDSTSNITTTVNSSTQNWKHALADYDVSASFSTRGASGQILYNGADRHLLWNNGSRVFYQYNTDPISSLASDTYVGECSMALNPAGTLFVVYSKGGTVATKEVYMRSKPAGGAFAAESQKTTSGKECIGASVFIDTVGNPHIVWSSRDNTTDDYWYIIKYSDLTTTYNVSTHHGGLPFTEPTPTTPIVGWQPKGSFYNGKLNIFYVDNTKYTNVGGGVGSDRINIAWQYYGGSSFSDNTLRILSGRDAFNDLILSLTPTSEDDLFVTFFSDSGASRRINFAKIDVLTPQVSITSLTSLNLLETYSLTFTVSESDIATMIVQWDGQSITANVTDRSIDIPSSLITYGPHPYSIYIEDEVGNKVLLSGTVDFLGMPFDAVLTIIIIAVAGAVAIMLGVYYSKNKAKFMKRKLGLKLEGKPAADTWDEGAPVEEEGPSSDEGNMDLKKDLKKVDM
jgi:hypothetical protein